jgi:hypothetical protein
VARFIDEPVPRFEAAVKEAYDASCSARISGSKGIDFELNETFVA